MRNLKRMLGLSGLTALLVGLVAAVPAQAQAPQAAAACAVDGTATTTPAVQIEGGSGTYRFDSTVGAGLQLTCVVGTTAHGSGLAEITVTSTGNYVNTVCGTGTARSADLDPVNPPASGNDITTVAFPAGNPGNLDPVWLEQQEGNLEYDIPFVGTVGALTFRSSDPGNATGGGPIKITDPTPAEINPATNTCTSDFRVLGALAGTLP
jgi:hypothetical protein